MRGYAATATPRYGVSWLVALYLVIGGIVAATITTGRTSIP